MPLFCSDGIVAMRVPNHFRRRRNVSAEPGDMQRFSLGYERFDSVPRTIRKGLSNV
jgi:hypothetical protein